MHASVVKGGSRLFTRACVEPVMHSVVRFCGYATALTLVFGAAWGVGSAVRTGPGSAPIEAPSIGLSSSAAGYTVVPLVDTLTPGITGEYAFGVTGPDGLAVVAPVGLVVVRRDAAGFQHLDPEVGPDGVWRTPLTLPAGGVYRVYVDVVATGGPPLTLGVDLFAPGDFAPIPFPPSRVAQVDDYQVRLDGELVPGSDSPVFATVSRGGAAVTDLEPHRSAFGHLVALRRSDLAYLYVPPDAPVPAATDRSGPGIAFTAAVPTRGSYRLFLDFRHGGVVRTAEFTVDAD